MAEAGVPYRAVPERERKNKERLKMGCLMSCFGGGDDELRQEEDGVASTEARSKAAEAAQKRQEQYQQSAAGRAARAQIERAAKQSARSNSNKGEPVLKWQMG